MISQSWMRTDYSFVHHWPVATVIVNERDAATLKEAVMALDGSNESDIMKLEQRLREFIIYKRPDLKGIILYGIQFNIAALRWEIIAVHEAFPKRARAGDVPPEVRL